MAPVTPIKIAKSCYIFLSNMAKKTNEKKKSYSHVTVELKLKEVVGDFGSALS